MKLENIWYGKYVMIVDEGDKIWRGRVRLLDPGYDVETDTELEEIEIGIDYAGGIRAFRESEVKFIGECVEQYNHIKLKDGQIGTVVDYAGPDYIVDIGDSAKNWDTILVKYEDGIGVQEK